MLQFLLTQIGKMKSAVSGLDSKIKAFDACPPISMSFGSLYNTLCITLSNTTRGMVFMYGVDGHGKAFVYAISWDGTMTTADVNVIVGDIQPTVTFSGKKVSIKMSIAQVLTAYAAIQTGTATWSKENT